MMLQSPCCTFILKVHYHHNDHHLGLLDPWKWDRRLVLKRRYENAILRCVKFQNSAALIYNAAEAEMAHHYHSSSLVRWWLAINELERWKEAVVTHFQLLSWRHTRLEKPVGAADNQDSMCLRHGTAALRNDICTRSCTADFRDEIYIRNVSKSIYGSIFYPASSAC
jgi:hypothetical protein